MSIHDLYQQLIVDHSRSTKFSGEAADHTHSLEGHNPLCGDQITISLRVTEGLVQEVKFQGHGCAISKASASLMCDAIQGLSVVEVARLFKKFHAQLTGGPKHDLGKLSALSTVQAYPMRVKCATLAWHTMIAALEQQTDKVTTE